MCIRAVLAIIIANDSKFQKSRLPFWSRIIEAFQIGHHERTMHSQQFQSFTFVKSSHVVMSLAK